MVKIKENGEKYPSSVVVAAKIALQTSWVGFRSPECIIQARSTLEELH